MNKWISIIVGNSEIRGATEKRMEEVYKRTQFFSIKSICKVDTEEEMYQLEREILIKVIKKHKDVYNALT